VPEGIVISQNPEAGFEVSPDTPVNLTVSLGQTFQIGDTGPGGGIVFALLNDEGTSGLEYAPVVIPNLAWGCLGTNVDPNNNNTDDGIDVASGEASSALLLTAITNGTCISPVANSAFAYIGPEGADDWYIPSTDELIAIRDSIVPSVNLPGILGDSYWSSTEDSQANAFLVFNDVGILPSTSRKDTDAVLLPIRTF